MKYENILYEKKNATARITLNRPQVLNALNHAILVELEEAMLAASNDDEVRVIILTGAGEKAFSAGVDIKSMGDPSKGDSANTGKDSSKVSNEIINLMDTMGKPVIAAVNGYALTGGLELILAADIIIATENSSFGDTHARWGLTPTWQGSQRFPRRISPNKAKELYFTCDMISATEAERLGLINKVVPKDKLEETLDELVAKIVANSVNSIKIIKHLVNKGLKMTLEDGIQMAAAESPGRTQESFERTQAFRNKTWTKPSNVK